MTKPDKDDNAVLAQKTPLCGVIGNPIEHSLSPPIHHQFAKDCGIDLSYIKILGLADQFEAQVKSFFNDGGKGLNVTLPFKERAFAMADIVHRHAKQSGVANTLWQDKQGLLHADNTDGLGLVSALAQHTDLEDKRLLVIGAGGAGIGVLPALLECPLKSIAVANRSVDKLEVVKTRFPTVTTSSLSGLTPAFDIIINATNTSMLNTVPEVDNKIYQNALCLDMFYDRATPTAFIDHALSHGASKAIDGWQMLVGQAARAFEIWWHIYVNPKSK